MKKPKGFYSIKISIGFVPSVIILTVISILLTYFSLILQIGTLIDFQELISNSGIMLFILNLLPIIIFIFIIFYASGSCMTAAGTVSFFVILFCAVNYYKIEFRHEPLMPWDFMLTAELIGISKSLDSALLITAALGIVISIVLITHLILFIRTKRIRPLHRIIAVAVLISLAAALNFGLYRNEELNYQLYINGNPYDDVAVAKSHGLIYSFLYNLNMTRISAPPSYNKQEIEALIDSWPTEAPSVEKPPHIIMIMGEAFSDIFDNINFDFTNYLDPLKYYKALQKESVSGYIVSPRVGGGTSDTEFDVLTGIATRHFLGAPYSYTLVRKPISGVPSLLSSLGYKNIAIHPGQPWFYNRENVYGYLGFDESSFIEVFDEIGSKKGMYISEEATISEIITQFKNHVNTSSQPLFEFCITIQNHGPFYYNYRAERNFDSAIDFTDDEVLSLSNYFEGLADADFQLNALVEMMRQYPDPVVIVYFGDHIPGFSENIYENALVRYFSDTYQLTRLNRTPFIIWQNEAAREANEFDAEKARKYNNTVISSNFLGVILLDLLEFVQADPYFDFIKSQVIPSYPVIFDNWYINSSDIPQNERWYPAQALSTMKSWEYYKLFVEKYTHE